MKFSEKWLYDWIETDIASADLAEKLTMLGHEVDAFDRQGDGLQGIVVAEVVSVARHPDADRLSVCEISTGGSETITVVCGAPNVVAGMKSPFAAPGCRLPGGLKLRKTKIRGVESNGMLCSAVELALGEESDGIIDLPADAPTGQELSEFLGLPDSLIDVDLTPNRGDCFSVLGIARDLAALPGTSLRSVKLVSFQVTTEDTHPVELPEPEACPRFAGRVIKNINPSAKTPLWMTERLRRSGLRNIHPVVDITNYVMLELGQPLHAYDMNRLQGAIRPRLATAGEQLTLLDGRVVDLRADTVIISDDSGPIGMAGIMGGLSTAVEKDTANVFFEAAFWPQSVVAGRARSYGMHTDASLRFERGVDPAGQGRAVDRATELLLAIAGGNAGPLTDLLHPEQLPKRNPIRLRHARVEKVLGADIAIKAISEILSGLGFEYTSSAAEWLVIPPSFRFDLDIEEDLIEEIARLYGYGRITESTGRAETPLATVSEAEISIDVVANALVARDYQEVITYSFIDAELDELVSGAPSQLRLANPISSEMSVMRSSLLPGMLSAAASNTARQQDRVRLFETGKSFHGSAASPLEVVRLAGVVTGSALAEQWGEPARSVDFFDIKSDVESLLAMSGLRDACSFVAGNHPALQPGQTAEIVLNDASVGFIGKLHPQCARHFGLKRDVFVFELDATQVFATFVVKAESISRYPSIRRDVAIVVREEVQARDLVTAVRATAPGLIRNIIVFDVYRGSGIEAGLKSVALGLILQETSRTLTDEDADSAMEVAVKKLEQEFAAALRD